MAERAIRESPTAFRRALLLPMPNKTPLLGVIEPWQARDFAALDPAWKSLASPQDWLRRDVPNHPGSAGQSASNVERGVVRRAWLERPRGHSKTADIAAMVMWILLASSHRLSGVVMAADRDQAALMRQAIEKLAKANPHLAGPLKINKHRVFHPATGAELLVLSSDLASSYGLTPDFIICDELCHWKDAGLWESLVSTAAKQAHCLLIVTTNAGQIGSWQWKVREEIRSSSAWYFSALESPQAPWIGPDLLEEQRALLAPAAFDRLWRNRWQTGDGEFVTLEDAEACRDEQLAEKHQGRHDTEYIAAIDYAEKHDDTAAIVLHRERGRLVIDRLDVRRPRPGHPTLVRWVEDWIDRIAKNFPRTTFVLDDYQLAGVAQRLERRHRVFRFPFAAGKGNHLLALTLRRLILHRDLAWYRGCGQIPGANHRDDLETELASLIVRQSSNGWMRIDHRSSSHDDRAFALGAACAFAESNAFANDELVISRALL